jgi:hypothetical protein
MLLLRPKSQSVINVPLGFIAIFVVMVVVFVAVPSARGCWTSRRPATCPNLAANSVFTSL